MGMHRIESTVHIYLSDAFSIPFSGIGFGIAQHLASQYDSSTSPFIIVLGCRNKARAESARDLLISQYFASREEEGQQVIQILLIDVGSIESVARACGEFKSR